MNKTHIITTTIIIAILALAFSAFLIYQQSEEEAARPEPLEAYVFATSTEAYTIDVNVGLTGIEEIDLSNAVSIEQLETELIALATSTEEMGSAPYELVINTQDFQDPKSGLSSQVLTAYQYTGGAHGLTNYTTWTYDSETGDIYELGNILEENENTMNFLFNQLKAKDSLQDADQEWLNTGAGLTWDNYSLFHVRPGGMTFIFPQYQVAPYALGVVELNLSWTDLLPYLRGGIASQINQ